MNRSEQIDQLAAALALAQAEIATAARQSANPFFGSSYADLSSIWSAARGPLTKNGLSVSQFPETLTLDGAGMMVSVTTMLMHKSGQFLAGEIRMLPSKTDPQGLGSLITYGRRYGLAAICGVVSDGEGDDGNAAKSSTSQAGAKPVAAKPKQINDDVAPEVHVLGELIAKLVALDKSLSEEAIVGSIFTTKAGKQLRWDEVRAFHTDRQLKWVRSGIAEVGKIYQEVLAQHPEDVSQDQGGDG